MGDMDKLAASAIGVMSLIVIFAVIPMVGSQIDSATPTMDADSNWNSTYNEDLQDGSDLWESVSGMLILAAILGVIGVVIGAVMRFKGSN